MNGEIAHSFTKIMLNTSDRPRLHMASPIEIKILSFEFESAISIDKISLKTVGRFRRLPRTNVVTRDFYTLRFVEIALWRLRLYSTRGSKYLVLDTERVPAVLRQSNT